jgi:hypothetical protein
MASSIRWKSVAEVFLLEGKIVKISTSVSSTLALLVFSSSAAMAALVTDPNDPRNWQGATVGTFATLYYGADNATTRQQVIDNQLLDDGLFNSAGSSAATLTSGAGLGAAGYSLDNTGSGDFSYGVGGDPQAAGNAIDNLWVQTSNTIGLNVWDFGGQASNAAIFNTIDHGPLPQEAIESTVYLSNDQITWTQAVTKRVWLEGFMTNLGIKWDGFAYAVGTATNETFRYASIIWGGPGALINDGDNEINGVLGLDTNFDPISDVPLPAALPLLVAALGGLGLARRRKA